MEREVAFMAGQFILRGVVGTGPPVVVVAVGLGRVAVGEPDDGDFG